MKWTKERIAALLTDLMAVAAKHDVTLSSTEWMNLTDIETGDTVMLHRVTPTEAQSELLDLNPPAKH